MIDRNWRGDTIDEEIDEIFKMFEQSFCLEGHSGAPFHHQHIFTSPKNTSIKEEVCFTSSERKKYIISKIASSVKPMIMLIIK